jgi:hypothetical protein
MEARQTNLPRDPAYVGVAGFVTGKIAPDTLGQVTIGLEVGTETFSARSFVEGAIIPVGTEIVVNRFLPPRTVLVSKIS